MPDETHLLDELVPTLGSIPLSVLVASAEERVRRVAARLELMGVLKDDPGLADLLSEVRVRLMVAATRIEDA